MRLRLEVSSGWRFTALTITADSERVVVAHDKSGLTSSPVPPALATSALD
jgi:hypothetical protein